MSFSQGTAQALRPGNGDDRDLRRLAVALAVSFAMHAVLLTVVHAPASTAVPAPPPPLVARLVAPPKPVEPPAEPAPPPVIKDTLAPPKAEVLEDYIKPQPRRRITERPEPQPPKPRPLPPKPPPVAEKPSPREAPVAEKPPPPVPPVAAAEPARRSLDLSIPPEPRARSPERLSPQELNQTLTRLSETMLYPSEALRRGLQGEVVIVVELGDGGRILNADIASGSGHAVLDEAAVRAVLKLGTLGPTTAHRTILLPVRFRIL